MAGGFVEEPRPVSTPLNGQNKSTLGSAEPLLSLTAKQERRLTAHLDDRLLGLERDERKQAFVSIPALLDRLFPLLHLILQIPPRAPWADLRISYLLNLTGFVATYITSLPLLPPKAIRSRGEKAESEAGTVMRDILTFLDEVERGWMAVLQGQAWIMDSESDDGEGERDRRRGQGVHVEFSGSVGQTERYVHPANSADGRTRLRSIIISSRAKLTAWARTYGSFTGSTLSSTTTAPESNGARQTMGCDGADDFDPDPPTSYTPSAISGMAGGGVGAWEDQILGMWNTILERLTDQDLGSDRGR